MTFGRSDKKDRCSLAGESCNVAITVSLCPWMDEHVKNKLRPIEVSEGYLSNTKEVREGMLTNVKGVNGGLGWLASTERPDMAATHSIVPSGYDRRSPQLISELNAAVQRMSRGSADNHNLVNLL